MSNTPDLSKIVQLIMENPQLIEAISGLAAGEKTKSEEAVVEPNEKSSPEPEVKPSAVTTLSENSSASAKARRAQLLGALKPYVSDERAKAIDSMMSIADIVDMIKTR